MNVAAVTLVFAQADTVSDSSLVGCYALAWGDGPSLSPYFPSFIRLTLEPSRIADRYLLRVSDNWKRRTVMGTYFWVRTASDSLHIGHTDGFTGTSLHVGLTSTGFKGMAVSYSDVIDPRRPFPEWSVEGRSISCPDYLELPPRLQPDSVQTLPQPRLQLRTLPIPIPLGGWGLRTEGNRGGRYDGGACHLTRA